MKKENGALQRVGVFLFFIGYLIGMGVLGISVVGDFEGNMFYPSIIGDTALNSLDCPVFMDTSEVGKITATITNTADTRITPSVWVHISEGFYSLIREDRVNLDLEPGESQPIQWTISQEDAAYGHWVLLKIFVYSQSPLPSSKGFCGVFTADFKGLTGKQFHILSLAMSGVFMVAGGSMWALRNRPLRGKAALNMMRSIVIMGVVVTAGLIASIMGSYLWLLSAAMFIVGALLILIFLFGV